MKHTPAPWAVRGANAIWGNPQQAPNGRTDFTAVTGTINNEADAALIAAAPELLAALQNLLLAMSEYDPDTGKGERRVNAAANAAHAVVLKAGGAA